MAHLGWQDLSTVTGSGPVGFQAMAWHITCHLKAFQLGTLRWGTEHGDLGSHYPETDSGYFPSLLRSKCWDSFTEAAFFMPKATCRPTTVAAWQLLFVTVSQTAKVLLERNSYDCKTHQTGVREKSQGLMLYWSSGILTEALAWSNTQSKPCQNHNVLTK